MDQRFMPKRKAVEAVAEPGDEFTLEVKSAGRGFVSMTGPLLSRNHAKVAVGRPNPAPPLSSDAPALSVGQSSEPRTSCFDATRMPQAPQVFLERSV